MRSKEGRWSVCCITSLPLPAGSGDRRLDPPPPVHQDRYSRSWFLDPPVQTTDISCLSSLPAPQIRYRGRAAFLLPRLPFYRTGPLGRQKEETAGCTQARLHGRQTGRSSKFKLISQYWCWRVRTATAVGVLIRGTMEVTQPAAAALPVVTYK